MDKEQELLNINLPKWPQMLTTGRSVSVGQAKEIIRRTDSFLVDGHGGNNHKYESWVCETLKREPDIFSVEGLYDLPYEERLKLLQEKTEKITVWKEKWNAIETSYVRNSWISYFWSPWLVSSKR